MKSQKRNWRAIGFIVLGWGFLAGQSGADPTIYVAAGNNVGCQPVLYVVDCASGTIRQSQPLLTNWVAERFVAVSSNPGEAGLVVASCTGPQYFRGEGEDHLAIVDIPSLNVRKVVLLGALTAVGAVGYSYPPTRSLYTYNFERIALTPELDVASIGPAGWPVSSNGPDPAVDPLLFFTRSTAKAPSHVMEAVDLRSHQIVATWTVAPFEDGWEFGGVPLPLNQRHTLFLGNIYRRTGLHRPSDARTLIVAPHKGTLIARQEIPPFRATDLRFSPDHDRLYGWEMSKHCLVVMNPHTYQVEELMKAGVVDSQTGFGWSSRGIDVSPDGNYVVVSFSDHSSYRKKVNASGALMIWHVRDHQGQLVELPAGTPVGVIFAEAGEAPTPPGKKTKTKMERQ